MKKGDSASKNFVLEEQIKTIDDLIFEIYNRKSLFWRHRVHPTSFFLSWPLKLILETIKRDHFWTIKRKKNEPA